MKITDLHNTRAGQPAVVVGSGPSILDTDLSVIPDHAVTIGINRIWTEPFAAVKSWDFWVYQDPKVAREYSRTKPDLGDAIWVTLPGAGGPHIHKDRDESLLVSVKQYSCRGKMKPCPAIGSETGEHGLWRRRSSLLRGVHLAIVLGCDPIIVVGVDMGMDSPDRRHCFTGSFDEARHKEVAKPHKSGDYPWWNVFDVKTLPYFDAFVETWGARHNLINASPRTNLTSWPRMTLEQALA